MIHTNQMNRVQSRVRAIRQSRERRSVRLRAIMCRLLEINRENDLKDDFDPDYQNGGGNDFQSIELRELLEQAERLI